MSSWKKSLYISIDAHLNPKNALTGKYNFHSLHKNIPAYVREGGTVPKVAGAKYYLVHYPNLRKWYFQNDGDYCFLRPGSKGGGYMCLQSQGKGRLMLIVLFKFLNYVNFYCE